MLIDSIELSLTEIVNDIMARSYILELKLVFCSTLRKVLPFPSFYFYSWVFAFLPASCNSKLADCFTYRTFKQPEHKDEVQVIQCSPSGAIFLKFFALQIPLKLAIGLSKFYNGCFLLLICPFEGVQLNFSIAYSIKQFWELVFLCIKNLYEIDWK